MTINREEKNMVVNREEENMAVNREGICGWEGIDLGCMYAYLKDFLGYTCPGPKKHCFYGAF